MSRSRHHGCGKSCGLCKPHKRFKTNGKKNANRQRRVELEARQETTA